MKRRSKKQSSPQKKPPRKGTKTATPAPSITGRQGLSIWRRLRTIATVLSVLLNILLAYFAFRPNVSVDYNSSILPPNSYALPVRVSNHGVLPIHDVIAEFTETATGDHDLHIANNRSVIPIAAMILANRADDTVYSMVSVGNKPLEGRTNVVIRYRLPLLPIKFSTSQTFAMFANRNGEIRWVLE